MRELSLNPKAIDEACYTASVSECERCTSNMTSSQESAFATIACTMEDRDIKVRCHVAIQSTTLLNFNPQCMIYSYTQLLHIHFDRSSSSTPWQTHPQRQSLTGRCTVTSPPYPRPFSSLPYSSFQPSSTYTFTFGTARQAASA